MVRRAAEGVQPAPAVQAVANRCRPREQPDTAGDVPVWPVGAGDLGRQGLAAGCERLKPAPAVKDISDRKSVV